MRAYLPTAYRPSRCIHPSYLSVPVSLADLVSLHVFTANVHGHRRFVDLNQDGLCRNIPLGRVGQAEEVAEAAVFLAQNSYANNCVLTIDGGLTAGFGPV